MARFPAYESFRVLEENEIDFPTQSSTNCRLSLYEEMSKLYQNFTAYLFYDRVTTKSVQMIIGA